MNDNDDWRYVIIPEDFLIEQKLGLNIFKPHIKEHFRIRNTTFEKRPSIDDATCIEDSCSISPSIYENDSDFSTVPDSIESLELPTTKPLCTKKYKRIRVNFKTKKIIGLPSPTNTESPKKPKVF
jgi:hypothetical protein